MFTKLVLLSLDCDAGKRLSVHAIQNVWLDTRYKFNIDLVAICEIFKSENCR